MEGIARSRGARTWADVVVIFVGVTMLTLAIWPGDPLASQETAVVAVWPDLLWLLQATAGLLALAAVTIAQAWRRRALARGFLLAAVVALAIGLFTFRYFGWRAWLMFVLPAVLLLIALPGLGPMPPPERTPGDRT